MKCGRVALLGVIGDDGHGFELMRALHSRERIDRVCAEDFVIPTFTYTKLINGATGVEDLPRIDYVSPGPLPGIRGPHPEHLPAIFETSRSSTSRIRPKP